ncbi:radical SAM protein with 4Fe4S-binding SPASM domain [Microbacter margulisiae]|uniref:Radical SAM protein with 4Fe4S-binding SPASM domain n=2 Tax=Microbacter margulisiae TaxID=1350067 RepID=A0A7W5H3C3_9PORP|nr:radical SAM protein with 4Fe4S-binding SPASM domain [Microbacter margulisiae]
MFLKDYISWIRKGYNLLQLIVSYSVSVILKRPLFPMNPFSVSIEPSNQCNLHCPECPTGNGSLIRPKQMMNWDLYTKIIDELAPNISNLILYFQGEPLLHSKLPEMIRYAHAHKIYTMISTNGQLVTKETAYNLVTSGLNRIIISIDGTTQDVYNQYRKGGNLEKVRDAIILIAHWKKELHTTHPHIEAQFIVMQHNEHQIHDFKKMVNQLGADSARLKTAQIDWPNITHFVPKQTKFARYKQNKQGNWVLKHRLKNRCWRQWSSAVITSNGDVLPCCFDKNGEYVFGNMKQASFREIWHNKKAVTFRNSILHNRKQFEMCRNCTS